MLFIFRSPLHDLLPVYSSIPPPPTPGLKSSTSCPNMLSSHPVGLPNQTLRGNGDTQMSTVCVEILTPINKRMSTPVKPVTMDVHALSLLCAVCFE